MRKMYAKVTPEIVDTIYKLRTKGKMTHLEISKITNLSDATIKNIWFLIKNAQRGIIVDSSMRNTSQVICTYINETYGCLVTKIPEEKEILNHSDDTLISVLNKVATELNRHNNLLETVIRKFEYRS